MERLTQTSDKGGVAFTFDLDIACKASEAHKILRLAEKLKEYEDAEEQGLILRLPFKIGDTVYCIYQNEVIENQVADYDIWSLKNGITLRIKLEHFNDYIIGVFGKTVFLTKEEAEQKLAEMKGDV